MRVDFSIFLGQNTVTTFVHNWVSFEEWTEEQMSTSNFSEIACRCYLSRILQNCANDCSSLVRIHSKKDRCCTEGRRWPNNLFKQICAAFILFLLFSPNPVNLCLMPIKWYYILKMCYWESRGCWYTVIGVLHELSSPSCNANIRADNSTSITRS